MVHWVQQSLRKYRLEKNYSQEYMAFQLNLSQTSYGRIENGKTPLTIEMLEKILLILNIDLLVFLNKAKEYKE
jgi:transcriptional regulator with XRE-family HTH domain